MQIVIAWTEDDIEIIRHRRTDLGELPETRPVKRACAAMWLNEGTEADVERARAYAAKDGRTVLTFSGEADPLGAARNVILKARKP